MQGWKNEILTYVAGTLLTVHCIVRWCVQHDRACATGKTQLKSVNVCVRCRLIILTGICSLKDGMVSRFHACKVFCVMVVIEALCYWGN